MNEFLLISEQRSLLTIFILGPLLESEPPVLEFNSTLVQDVSDWLGKTSDVEVSQFVGGHFLRQINIIIRYIKVFSLLHA